METFVSLYFLVLALILLVVLVFLYRLMLAINRLDRRVDQFARHLRDLNLYDLQPPEAGVFSPETEVDGAGTTPAAPSGRTTATGQGVAPSQRKRNTPAGGSASGDLAP